MMSRVLRSICLSLTLMAGSANSAVFNDFDASFSWTTDTQTGLDWLDFNHPGLWWDDLTAPVHPTTIGRSRETIEANLGAGGDYDGWRFATTVEVDAFVNNAAAQILPGLPPVEPGLLPDGRVVPFVGSFTGYTQSTWYGEDGIQLITIDGLTAIPPNSDPEAPEFRVQLTLVCGELFACSEGVYSHSAGWAVWLPVRGDFVTGTEQGAWLVRNTPTIPLPLPGGLPLFAAGLGILGLLGWENRLA